jgi:tRNA (guanine26-N2/guanine27-N2)-dimethyltransferase
MNKNPKKSIIEGETQFYIDNYNKTQKGPSSKGKNAFYNQSMELNRDLSICVLQWFINKSNKKIQILDGLAASGIRGIRFANELNGDFHIYINDWSNEAYKIIKYNTEQIENNNISISKENIHSILSNNKFDYIDIDPFGSPAQYIDSALRSIKHKGIIAVTATDTATLCGVYPKVCLRRYNAYSLHGSIMHEVGLRILIGFISRQAGKYDIGIKTILSYSTDHYMRLYLQIIKNINESNESINNTKILTSNEIPGSNLTIKKYVGPLWMGRLHFKQALKEIRSISSEKTLNKKNQIIKLIDIFEDESNAPVFYYSTNYISSELKISPPSLSIIFKELMNKGYEVYKTQFDPTGFKTNADYDIVKSIIKKVNGNRNE